jgi:hypothetical protein
MNMQATVTLHHWRDGGSCHSCGSVRSTPGPLDGLLSEAFSQCLKPKSAFPGNSASAPLTHAFPSLYIRKEEKNRKEKEKKKKKVKKNTKVSKKGSNDKHEKIRFRNNVSPLHPP